MRYLCTLLAFIVVFSAAIARGDVTTAEAAKMMKKSSTIVVDVRTPAEYADGHMRGARLMDFYAKDFWTQVVTLPKDATIVVYCKSGRRSKETETKLASMGYSHVVNMLGGFDAWKKEQRQYAK
jgi:phage shock protein E